MSHTITQRSNYDLRFVTLTIVNYATGGEAVAATEVEADIASIIPISFGIVPAGQNSLGVPLIPVLNGGNIMLLRFVSGSPVEVPTTTALNAVVQCLIGVVLN